jgi:hypothetical protein
MVKIRIYILCYNDLTENKANESFGKYEWAKILRINSTLYLENIMYDSWLLDNKEDWENFDYVGTLSWKALTKIKLPNMDEIIKQLEIKKPDLFPFLVGKLNMIKRTDFYHPLFSKIWVNLLTKLNFTEDMILSNNILPFYCNYWICPPKLMLEYIDFFKKAKDLIEKDQELQINIWQNSLYLGIPKSDCMKIFGVPFYPYHPFICERLPCFFFWSRKSKIIFDPQNIIT